MDLVLRQTSSMLIARNVFDTTYMAVCLLLIAKQTPVQTLPMSPIQLFVCCAVVSTVAGMASLLRTREGDINTTLVLSHALNMGTCGASLAMLLYALLHPRENLEWMIIGFAGLFSLGGMGSIDWVVSSTQKMIQKIFSGGKSE